MSAGDIFHSIDAGSMMFLRTILFVLSFTNFWVYGPARYEAESTGVVFGFKSLIRCFTMWKFVKWSSYMIWSSEIILLNSFRKVWYFEDIAASSRQSILSWVVLLWWVLSCHLTCGSLTVDSKKYMASTLSFVLSFYSPKAVVLSLSVELASQRTNQPTLSVVLIGFLDTKRI